MKRLDPALNSGTPLYFNGNKNTGAPGTIPQAEALNHLQEELAYLVEHAGLVLGAGTTQVDQAISAKIAAAAPTSNTPDQLIGAILFSASTAPTLPPNCLVCNGAAFNPATYPVLAARYPAHVTPNIPAGYALIQGITGFGNLWAGAVQSHAHPYGAGFSLQDGAQGVYRSTQIVNYALTEPSGSGGTNNYAAGIEGFFYIVAK